MINHEHMGALRVQTPGLFRLMVRGQKIGELTATELDALAAALSFRLTALDRKIVHGATGVELLFEGADRGVHLCYSDEAEDFARAVMQAASRNGVTV